MNNLDRFYLFCIFIVIGLMHAACVPAISSKTADDLGQIVIPSNQIRVRVGLRPTVTMGRPRSEAAEMIQTYLHSQKPDPYPEALIAVEELQIPGMWESLSAQLFRITEGPSLNESYLIRGDSVLQLGMAFGGRGLTNVEITDLDQDGQAELLIAYSFGSGIHQSRMGMYAPAYDDGRVFEADTAYLGDLNLYQDANGKVSVRVVELDDRSLTLSYADTLGYLRIDQQDGQAALIFQTAERIPEEVRQKLFPVN